MDDGDSVLGIIIVIASIFLFMYETQPYKWLDDSYIPTYEMHFKDKVILSDDIEYFIQKENNQVVSKNHDTGTIDTIKNCSIVDRKNWTCTNGNVSLTLLDGILNIERHSQSSSLKNYYGEYKPIWRIAHYFKNS